jgi:hypothetical protein
MTRKKREGRERRTACLDDGAKPREEQRENEEERMRENTEKERRQTKS